MIHRIVMSAVRLCSRRAVTVTGLLLFVAAAGAVYDARNFAMDSSTENIVSSDAPWRVQQKAFDAAFPQHSNLIVIVVDGATAERAEQAASALAAELSKRRQFFTSVRRPDGNAFFAHNGLLFLSPSAVKKQTSELISAQPFLGALALDPSLRGIMNSLSAAMLGVEHGQASLADIKHPLTAFSATLRDALTGKPSLLAWRALVTGDKPGKRELRRFIEVKPVLDYGMLMPGFRATAEIRRIAAALKLAPEYGVRVRLTGNVPMEDEEFGTLAEHAGLLGALMMSGVLLMLWLAVRSAKVIAAILVTLTAGLAITTAFGLLAVGAFNVISVAFIPLFVGLGVDFGIQFSVRYRAERHANDDLYAALEAAGGGIGAALSLAAAAIAVGFLSFLPTGYAGVAELGLIAGAGMIVTFVLSLTLLPALLVLLRPSGEPGEIGIARFAALDRTIETHHGAFIGGAILLALAGLAALPWVRFDFNPMDLRSPRVESVATALDLMKDPETSPNTIDVLVPDRAAATRIAARLAKLPEVGQVLTIDSFVPDHQAEKLAMIGDASMLLDSTLNPFFPKPAPSDAENMASLKATAHDLRDAAAKPEAKSFAAQAIDLAAILEGLAAAPPAARARANQALLPGMATMLDEVRGALQAQAVTRQSLPPDLVEDWVSKGSLYRIEVSPRGNSNDNDVLARFSAAVRAVAPNATGAPIIIQDTGRTIVRAFIEAGILSFLAISVLLGLWLRRLKDVMLALGPVLFAGVLALATCVAIGMPLNYANIIALPLLFGIGVAFDIYFVMAWRAGASGLLQSPLSRAVILSAGTTACGFGMLSLSSHPGTASMGVLLFISLGWILVAVLFLLPALFARFRAQDA